MSCVSCDLSLYSKSFEVLLYILTSTAAVAAAASRAMKMFYDSHLDCVDGKKTRYCCGILELSFLRTFAPGYESSCYLLYLTVDRKCRSGK